MNFYFKNLKRRFRKRNNNFILIKNNGKRVKNPHIKNLDVKFGGDNNYFEIHENFKILKKVKIYFGNNNTVKIGKNCSIDEAKIYLYNNDTLDIGNDTTAHEIRISIWPCKNTKVIIGANCMLSYNILFRPTDAHIVYDKNTKEIINQDKDIIIKDHVWLAENVTVLKGAYIPSNCIGAANCLVNKRFDEENCIIAGIPAKIVKKGINWER